MAKDRNISRYIFFQQKHLKTEFNDHAIELKSISLCIIQNIIRLYKMTWNTLKHLIITFNIINNKIAKLMFYMIDF